MNPFVGRACVIFLWAVASTFYGQPGGIPTDAGKRNATIKWVNEPKPGTLPTGVTHHTFFSKALNRDVGYCIYLPPNYARETSRRFR